MHRLLISSRRDGVYAECLLLRISMAMARVTHLKCALQQAFERLLNLCDRLGQPVSDTLMYAADSARAAFA